jgi:hypothetical protein
MVMEPDEHWEALNWATMKEEVALTLTQEPGTKSYMLAAEFEGTHMFEEGVEIKRRKPVAGAFKGKLNAQNDLPIVGSVHIAGAGLFAHTRLISAV